MSVVVTNAGGEVTTNEDDALLMEAFLAAWNIVSHLKQSRDLLEQAHTSDLAYVAKQLWLIDDRLQKMISDVARWRAKSG